MGHGRGRVRVRSPSPEGVWTHHPEGGPRGVAARTRAARWKRASLCIWRCAFLSSGSYVLRRFVDTASSRTPNS